MDKAGGQAGSNGNEAGRVDKQISNKSKKNSPASSAPAKNTQTKPAGTQEKPRAKIPAMTENWVDDGIGALPGDNDNSLDNDPSIDFTTYADDAVEITQPKLTPKPELEKQKIEALKTPARKIYKKEAHQTAVILMSLLDGIATILAGPGATMNDIEQELISEPLERMLMRMQSSTVDVLSKWSDPIMLTMGLVAWASRVARVVEEQTEERTQSEKQEQSITKQYPAPEQEINFSPQLIAEQLSAPIEIASQISAELLEIA
jgi:hypothetical protein